MSINIIPLDISHEKEQPAVLVGQNILIKFKPSKSLIENYKSLKKIIHSKDLLLNDTKLEGLQALVDLSESITELTSASVRFRDDLAEASKKIPKDEAEIKWLKSIVKSRKDRIIKNAQEIERLEHELKAYVAENHRLYFCSGCDGWLGELDEDLPASCPGCGQDTSDRSLPNICTVRYLSDEVKSYLNGKWLEDYVARILKKIGWETWASCSVMGSSGIDHEIDVLAIDKKSGKVVIVECKLTAEAEDPYKFTAQFADIQPTFGLFIVKKPLLSDSSKSFLAKKPGLRLVEAGGLSDDLIQKEIEDYISRNIN